MGDSLLKFKDIHKNKRGFIIACGPSLAKTDLSKLENEICFGTSLSYKSGLISQYNFMGDKQIASQYWKDIFYIPAIWFVSKSILLTYFLDRPQIYYFTGSVEKRFHTDISNGKMHGGGTSTFLAMQMAYWMGITSLYVVGLDHYKSYMNRNLNIKQTGKVNLSGQPLVKAIGKDEHHFTSDFYGKGTEYFLPTTGKMEASYKLARAAFEKDGREIYNLSLDTALSEEVIPRKSFEDVV